jgi:hypothetical protein
VANALGEVGPSITLTSVRRERSEHKEGAGVRDERVAGGLSGGGGGERSEHKEGARLRDERVVGRLSGGDPRTPPAAGARAKRALRRCPTLRDKRITGGPAHHGMARPCARLARSCARPYMLPHLPPSDLSHSLTPRSRTSSPSGSGRSSTCPPSATSASPLRSPSWRSSPSR